MDAFECASVTLAACRPVLGRLTADDLGRPSPCSEYTVGEVGLIAFTGREPLFAVSRRSR